MIQALEAVRCLDDGVLDAVPDANIGSIFGWGFAPFQGGTLQYINAVGLPAFIDRARTLADRFGERFTPPERLVQMAEDDVTF
jgi:3-hydroxyacyl-CoA dehydrogenase/enoyl-CoA hydratase/3-hydroxybutyryl-CoA epimerase